MLYYIVSVLFFLFVWYPCMAINVSMQRNSGLLVDPRLLPSRNPFKYHVEALSVQPMKQYIIIIPCLMMYYYIVSVLFLLFVWCPCMTINKCTV